MKLSRFEITANPAGNGVLIVGGYYQDIEKTVDSVDIYEMKCTTTTCDQRSWKKLSAKMKVPKKYFLAMIIPGKKSAQSSGNYINSGAKSLIACVIFTRMFERQ